MALKRKPEGILRKTDSLGRLVIPKSLRQKLGIGENDMVEIIDCTDHLIVRKYRPRCVFCSGTDGLLEYNGKFVCRSCLAIFRR